MSARAPNSSATLPNNLPDDFFDSHKKSKKVQEDELAKELEQFEKDMAVLEAESEEQLREEFEKLQEYENINELDEQFEQWRRIIELEKKAEELQNKLTSEKPAKRMKVDSDGSSKANSEINGRKQEAKPGDDDDNLDNIEDFEDRFFNWRSKGL